MIRFLRLSLAVFRLCVFLRYDDFPLIKWIRDDWSVWRPRWWEFWHCWRCLSVHSGWIVLVLDRIKQLRWIVDILALSGATILFHDLIWIRRK